MSHFTVLVTGENPKEQLAPFNEDVYAGSPYASFNDETDEYREGYENGFTDMVRLKSGEVLSKYDDRFRTRGLFDQKFIVPSDAKEITISHKERYGTFEKYCDEYYGATENNGRYGFWANPNAKWDWYKLGGRWGGFFNLVKRFARLRYSMKVSGESVETWVGGESSPMKNQPRTGVKSIPNS